MKDKTYTVQYDWNKIVAGIKEKNIISQLLPALKLETSTQHRIIDDLTYITLQSYLDKQDKEGVLATLLSKFQILKQDSVHNNIVIDYNQLESAWNKECEQNALSGLDESISLQSDSSNFVKKFVTDIEHEEIAKQIIKYNPGIKGANDVDKKFKQEYQNVKNSSNMKDLLEHFKILLTKIQQALGLSNVTSAADQLKDVLIKQNHTKGGFKELKQEVIQEENLQTFGPTEFNEHMQNIKQQQLQEENLQTFGPTEFSKRMQNIKQQQLQEEKHREYDIMRQNKRKENNKKIDELSSIKGILNGIQENIIVQSHNSSIKDKKAIDYSQEVQKAYECVRGSKDKASLIKNFENLLNTINKEAEKLNGVKGDIIDTEYYKKSLETGLASIEGNFSEIKDGLKNAKKVKDEMMKETVESLQKKQKQQPVVPPKTKFTQHANKQLKDKQPKQNSNHL